jgi:GntR family transcriptional regulator
MTSSIHLSRVTRSSEIPLYLQLKRLLLDKIAKEELNAGAMLPSERELEQLYNLSRTTVRQAINELVQEGILYKHQGRGTFVARPKIQPSLHRLTSFSEDMQMRGLKPSGRTLAFAEVLAEGRLASVFQVAEGIPLIYMKRLRLADDEPVGIHEAWLALPPGVAVDADRLNGGASIYQILEEEFDIQLKEADETLEVEIVDGEDAQLLDVPGGSPVLHIERLTFSAEGRPVEFVKMVYRGDRYKYYIHMTR